MKKQLIMFKIHEILCNKSGNFAIMAALSIPVLFMAGSLAVDTTNAMSMKIRLQNAADSAALATVTRLAQEKNLSIADAKAFAIQFVRGQVEEDLPVFAGMSVNPTITITPVDDNGRTIWRVAVALGGTHTLTPMARLLGQDSLSVNVISKSESAAESQGAFSMALVLDRSGSMAWNLNGQKKINVLKTAVGGLLDQFETADPARKYVRLGASSYHSYMSGKQNFDWNLKKVRKFVNALPASGGTNSTDAFKWGYTNVSSAKELNQHKVKNGLVPQKFIVFMTDGDNNYSSADTSTKQLCDQAKKDGVVVYTVAFAAPERGKQLLSYCASTAQHFFDAKSSADLISAFKNIGIQASKVASRLTE